MIDHAQLPPPRSSTWNFTRVATSPDHPASGQFYPEMRRYPCLKAGQIKNVLVQDMPSPSKRNLPSRPGILSPAPMAGNSAGTPATNHRHAGPESEQADRRDRHRRQETGNSVQAHVKQVLDARVERHPKEESAPPALPSPGHPGCHADIPDVAGIHLPGRTDPRPRLQGQDNQCLDYDAGRTMQGMRRAKRRLVGRPSKVSVGRRLHDVVAAAAASRLNAGCAGISLRRNSHCHKSPLAAACMMLSILSRMSTAYFANSALMPSPPWTESSQAMSQSRVTTQMFLSASSITAIRQGR